MGGFLTRGFDSERQEGVGHGVSIMRLSPLSSAMTAALTVRKAGPDTLGAERKIREGPTRGLPPPGRRGRPLGPCHQFAIVLELSPVWELLS